MNRNQRFVYGVAVVLIIGAGAADGAQAQVATGRVATRDFASEVACSALATTLPPATAVRVGPGREHGKALFGPGDALVIKGGTTQGIKAGEDYFVRRVVPDRFAREASDGVRTYSIHTAGWVHIVEVQADTAVATVTKACDGIIEGDYLEAFVKPALPPEATSGEPDYNNPGHLVLGDDRRQMGAQGDMMVLDRGSDHGLHAGQRLTIFRPTGDGAGPVAKIGEATAMIVGPESTVVRIEKVIDAVVVGDLVAIHR